jgi:crotonobetainyl-CoA:carnitine CoA-transferase CaiB-like acyl-CoA transferase
MFAAKDMLCAPVLSPTIGWRKLTLEPVRRWFVMGDNVGALAGLKVIDLSRVLGGPFCTQILGDHGADVLKIEPPGGDETRGWGPPFVHGIAPYFIGVNRNKKSMVLDIAQPASQELLLRLLSDADVLVENFKVGTLERWGLGYDTLSKRFPGLIHCRITGFGADGPLGGLPGYDAIIQAMSGIMSVNGERDGGPLRVGLPVVDMVTGLNAAIGILLALHDRAKTGKGQFVEAALYDSGLSLLHPHAANYFVSARPAVRTGNSHPNIAPYSLYATGTCPVFIAVGNDKQFRNLCEMIAAPQIPDDARFLTNAARVENRDALQVELETALAHFDGADIAPKLIAAGVPCGPLLGVAQALEHPHAAHREMIVEIGDYRGIGSPIKLSRTPASYRRPPPGFAFEEGAEAGETDASEQPGEAVLSYGRPRR